MTHPSAWSASELDRLAQTRELHIAAPRPDGRPSAAVPIGVVCVGADVYVRTWYRRRTGWFGRAVRTHQAWVEVGGVRREVDVVDVGGADTAVRGAVDEAYRDKYGAASAGSMTTDEAAATTLRLEPV